MCTVYVLIVKKIKNKLILIKLFSEDLIICIIKSYTQSFIYICVIEKHLFLSLLANFIILFAKCIDYCLKI